MNKLKVGCCGPGMSLDKYQKLFSVLEVQQTFYQPPKISTLQKWRESCAEDFEFTLKAWQLITHRATSPTFKRVKRSLDDREKNDAGSFQLTDIVKEAWAVTSACAEALKAKSILFQCPKSFVPSEQHQHNLLRFFSEIDRPNGMDLYFEPRGEWPVELIDKICKELKIFHAVDPLVHRTLTPQNTYYRLHGIGGYRHVYDDIDLEKICQLSANAGGGYVLFNNTSMTIDAQRFESIQANYRQKHRRNPNLT